MKARLTVLGVVLGCALLVPAGCDGPASKKESASKERQPESPAAKQDQAESAPKPADKASERPAASGDRAASAPARLTDVTEILQRADSALRAVKFVRYQIEHYPGDAPKPDVTGTVVLGGKSTGRPERYYMDLTQHGERERRVTFGSDGENAHWLVDYDARQVHAGNLEVLGPHAALFNPATIREFIHPQPFEPELQGMERALRGVTKVGDQDCYEVYVKYQAIGTAAPQSATWYLSVQDFLPRRVDRAPGFAGNMKQVLIKLEPDPNFEQNPFAPVVPEGFQRTTEPAK